MVFFVVGFEVVCLFVNDCFDVEVFEVLVVGGMWLIVLCLVGFNYVDLFVVQCLGLMVVCVLVYLLYVVVEYVVGMIFMFNWWLYCVCNCMCEGDFLLDGLFGFDLVGKIVGVVGMGQIGQVFVCIMVGFGCQLLVFDLFLQVLFVVLGVCYVLLFELLVQVDIVSLYCLFNVDMYYLIDVSVLVSMKLGVMFINISCGGLVDSFVLIDVFKIGQFGYFGLDVYEEEVDLFFEDCFVDVLQDDVLVWLLSFFNVIVIVYQVFFMCEVLVGIVDIMFVNVVVWVVGVFVNVVKVQVGILCCCGFWL